jgi:hypothetical protein
MGIMGAQLSARRRLAFTALALTIACVALLIAATTGFAAGLAKGDVSLTLGADGKLKVVVVAVDDAGVPVVTTAKITCGTSTKAGSGAVVNDAAATAHKIVLPGVTGAVTKYYYDIVLTGNGVTLSLPGNGGRYAFTSPPGGADVALTIADFGDSGPVYNQEWRDARKMFAPIAQGIAAAKPNLVLGNGDYINTYSSDSTAEVDLKWENFFEVANIFSASAPTMLTVGNHEGLGDATAAVDPTTTTQQAWEFWNDFPGATGFYDRVYSFDFGKSVHVVMLNDNSYNAFGFAGDGQPGNSPMAQWLIADLKANTRPWVIVDFHQPLADPASWQFWSGTPASIPPGGPEEAARLQVFLAQQGVDIVVSGHMHYYKRHFQDGVTYVTEGGAGSYIGPITQTPWDQYDVAGYSEYGFTIFKYAPKTSTMALTNYIVRANGGANGNAVTTTVGDTATLADNPKH